MKKNILSVLLSGSVVLSQVSLPAAAQEEPLEVMEETPSAATSSASIVYMGTIGTAAWNIDSEGVLTMGAGTFHNDDSNYEWPWLEHLDSVVRVDGTASFKVTGSLKGAFSTGRNYTVKAIDLSGWDTSEVTRMWDLFNGCQELTSVNISSWDTSSVTDMDSLFDSCASLKSLNLRFWDVSSVSDMRDMFKDCSSLFHLDVGSWDTSSVENMQNMFSGCSSLRTLNIDTWSSISVSSHGDMFLGCSSLQDIYCSNTAREILGWLDEQDGWYKSGSGPYSISSLPTISDGTVALISRTNKSVQYSGRLGSSIWTIDSSGLLVIGPGEFRSTSTDTPWPWKSHIDQITRIDGTAGFKVHGYLTSAFSSSQNTSIETADFSGWDTSAVVSMWDMFNGCSGLRQLDISTWDVSSVTDMDSMFENCSSLQSLEIDTWNTASLRDMREMFYGCNKLTELNLGSWNTSSAEYMQSMFKGCTALWSLDIGSWTVSSSVDTTDMFMGCFAMASIRCSQSGRTALNKLPQQSGWYRDGDGPYSVSELPDIPNGRSVLLTRTASRLLHSGYIGTARWTITEDGVLTIGPGAFDNLNSDYPWPWRPYLDEVTRVDGTADFQITGSLKGAFGSGNNQNIRTMDLTGWDTSGVTRMWDLFNGCSSLTDLNVCTWDTSSVTDMDSIFQGCSLLEDLEISLWNTSSLSDMREMFEGCSSLTSLDLGSWNVASAEYMQRMFQGCSSLRYLNMSSWTHGSLDDSEDVFSGCDSLEEIDYRQNCLSILQTLPVQSGWYLNGDGPYHIGSLPGLQFYDVGHLTRTSSKTQISAARISGVASSYTYTGNAIRPVPTLTVGSQRLISNEDYVLSYENNLSAGTATIQIEGRGRYSGNTSISFTIEPKEMSSIHLEGLSSSYDWTGSAIIPDVSLINPITGYRLREGADYTCRWENNVNPGTATLRITGRGNYKNSSVWHFQIHLDTPQLSLPAASYSWTGSAIQPEVTVRQANRTLRKGTDYTVSYSNNVNAGTATATVTYTRLPVSPQRISFQIVKDTPPVERISLSKATVSGIASRYDYTGQAISPRPTLVLNGKTLVLNQDYQVRYINNVQKGTATVTMTGIGAYTGSLTKTFEITAPKISLHNVSVSGMHSSYPWTGKPVQPEPILRYNGATLKKGVDYRLRYSNSTGPGIATIFVEAASDKYIDSIAINYTIIKAADTSKPGGSDADTKEPNSKQVPSNTERVSMHRLYNPNSGEHFYTADTNEKNYLVKVGWKFEGQGWVAPKKSSVPVYRLYNANAGDHHYTMNADEKKMLESVGWKYEGIGWYSDEKKSVPLYRQYNPNAKAGSHNYTTSKGENDGLVKLGWKAEGIAWYGLK